LGSSGVRKIYLEEKCVARTDLSEEGRVGGKGGGAGGPFLGSREEGKKKAD